MKCATPDFAAWVAAPPSSSNVTSSPVTVFTTSGPVMNMYDEPSTISTKSVIAGEYTAPPAHGPMTRLICGNDARGLHVAPEDLGVAGQRHDALLDARAAGVVDPDHGAAELHREVHHLADLLGEDLGQAAAEDREVLREDEHLAPEDRPVAGDDRVAPRPPLAHLELDLAMAHVAV